MDLKIRFGPAGADESYKGKTSDLPAFLKNKGLEAYEYQCGHGISIGQASAELLGRQAWEHGVRISLHAPYYISLTNPERTQQNIDYVRKSVQVASWMGARRIVVHTGAIMKMTRKQALQNAIDTVNAILRTAAEEAWFNLSGDYG